MHSNESVWEVLLRMLRASRAPLPLRPMPLRACGCCCCAWPAFLQRRKNTIKRDMHLCRCGRCRCAHTAVAAAPGLQGREFLQRRKLNRKRCALPPLLLPLRARGCCWSAGQCEILIYVILRNFNNSKFKFKLNCNDLILRNFNNFNLFNFEERLNRQK